MTGFDSVRKDESSTDVEIPFPLVPEASEELLSDKQVFDYRNRRERFAKWLLVFGKDPERIEGYSEATAKRTMYRVGAFERWVWKQEGEYTPEPTLDHADNYMEMLAFGNKSQSHKAACQHSILRYFKWRHHEYDEEQWDPDHSFSTPDYNQPRDYLTVEERKQLRRVALDWRELPYYQNYTPDEREAMKPYIAKRVDKPIDSLSREDWSDLTSWKVTSLVWTSLDTGLRPIEVERATTEWVDTENAVLRIPHDESSKNSENWVVSLRDDTADVLAEWLEERSYKPMYDDTDTLWLTQKGNPYTSRQLRRLIRKLCDEAGIRTDNRSMSWYSIRHSVGTWMTREEDLAAAQAQLRHKRPETTMKYDSAPPDDRRDALDRMG